MKKVRAPLLMFSALVTLGALCLLLWVVWPERMITRSVSLQLITPQEWKPMTTQEIGLQNANLLLNSPGTIKAGQSGAYQAVLTGIPSHVINEGMNYRLRVRGELIMPGIIITPEGMVTQGVLEGYPIRFHWDVFSLEPKTVRGELQIHLDYVSPSGQVVSQLLSVTELELTCTSLAGLSTTTATSLAVALVLLAGLTGGLGLSHRKSPATI